MALISIILGILFDRQWPQISQWRQLSWLDKLNQWQLEKTTKWLEHGAAQYLSLYLLPVIGIVILQALAADWLGLFALAFAVVIFTYCLGSLQIETQLSSLITALEEKDDQQAQEQLEAITGNSDINDDALNNNVIENSLARLTEYLLGVVFWFVILGPLGAVIYRLSRHLLDRYNDNEILAPYATKMVDLLNWLPERCLGFSFAITGNFDGAMSAYKSRQDQDQKQAANHFLVDLTNGALTGNDNDQSATYLSAYRSLVIRSLIVWLAVIALIGLLGW